MKLYKLTEVIVYLNIFCTICTVWAQTVNNEPPVPVLSGNTETLTHAMTQTPKSTVFETTHYDNSNPMNTSPEPTSNENLFKSKDITTESSTTETNKTEFIDNHREVTGNTESGSLSSKATTIHNSDVPQTSVLPINEPIAPTVTPTPVEMASKEPKTLSFGPNEELISSQNQTITTEMPSKETNDGMPANTSPEVIATTINPNDNVVKLMTTTVTPMASSEESTSKSSVGEQTTQSSVSTSSTTTPETSSAQPRESSSTTTPSTPQSPEVSPEKTTFTTTSQSNADNHYIPTLSKNNESDIESTQMQNNSVQETTEYSNMNASDVQSLKPETTQVYSQTTSSPFITSVKHEMTTPPPEPKQTEPQTPVPTDIMRPTQTTTASPSQEPKVSTESMPTTHTQKDFNTSETSENITHLTTKMTESEATTELSQQMNRSESPDVTNQTQSYEHNLTDTTSPDSVPPVDTHSTSPLISNKPNEDTKPMSTSMPEPNINTVKVILPNIKQLKYVNKEDMVNTVTITFITKSVEIYRWVTIFDQKFRNFTCSCIDSERNWCSIDRVIYVSPSPIVMNNHLLISFFINDSNENNSNSYHVFGGPMIVEALKNSTKPLEELMGMEVLSLQTNMGTIVVKPLETSSHRLAKFELLVFIFTLVMFICTVLLCLAIICSCAKRKSVDMNQYSITDSTQ